MKVDDFKLIEKRAFTVDRSHNRTDSEFPSGIGPHEGSELELMLQGIKPLASKPRDVFSDFKPYFDSGELIQGDSWDSRYFLVAIPGEEWRIDALHKIRQRFDSGEITPKKYHYLFGRLLGYDKQDIIKFINRSERINKQIARGEPVTETLETDDRTVSISISISKFDGGMRGIVNFNHLDIPGVDDLRDNIRDALRNSGMDRDDAFDAFQRIMEGSDDKSDIESRIFEIAKGSYDLMQAVLLEERQKMIETQYALLKKELANAAK